MIEKTLYDYLTEKLTVPVFFEAPSSPPSEYILIDRTGGAGFFINEPRFVIQSYSTSIYKASLLNEAVKAKMQQFRDEPEISKVTLNSDYNFSDVAKKKYRYQAVYDIICY